MIGQTISHYKILAKLGEGGMGVVYKAEDTKLERPVALKFLAPHLVSDQEIRKRFEREAKAAASLNHPNICTVHEIDEAQGRTFIAMAFIEGQPLDKKIEAGPLKLKDALDIAIQTAKGLQAAHTKGIVHRDIKPPNLMIGEDGQVTIMDFGLALLTDRSKLTRLDETMGTVTYMSPEQTYGMELDHRTDIWSLGVVLYEMVTGQQPFKGHYDKAVMYSITSEEPEPMTALRTAVPMELEWLANKCLAKDRDERYQNAGDIIVDLKSLGKKVESGQSTVVRSQRPALPSEAGVQPAGAAQPPHPVSVEPSRPRPNSLLLALLGVATLVAAALGFLYFTQASPDVPLYRFTVSLPDASTLDTFSLSPDGRRVALAMASGGGVRSLWVSSLETQELRELPGTDDARYPFWSPDSRYLGFFAGGKLKKIALSGGPPQSLCDAEDGRGGAWSREGVIVFSPHPAGEIQRVAEGGGETVTLTRREPSQSAINRRFPQLLPGGDQFLYLEDGTDDEQAGIYLGSLAGAEPRRLLRDESNATYATARDGERGFLLFVREDALMGQPFDAEHLELSGDPFPIVDEVGHAANANSFAFSASSVGSLIYRRGAGGRGRQLAWYDRQGVETEKLGEPANIRQVRLSPDERRAAVSIMARSNLDIWLLEFRRGLLSALTTHPGHDGHPVWSPDGSEIAFVSEQDGPRRIYRKPAGGAGAGEPLLGKDQVFQNPTLTDWSRDGRFLAFDAQVPNSSYDLFVIPLDGDWKPIVYWATKFGEENGMFSPDGRWMAYQSDKSGRSEVYIRLFPESDREWLVSKGGGFHPRWRGDGEELYYLTPNGTLMAVAIGKGATPEIAASQPLFRTRTSGSLLWGGSRPYDVSADGQRFVIANPTEEAMTPEFTVVSDWLGAVGR